ncbi:MAG: hypothetical protein RL015_341 [Verrucomicrobiota bacterium]|jgi:uncharacterized protein (TIGR03663 family)
MAPRKEVTISLLSFLFLVILAIGLGSFYRLPSLESRPMHTDEAILGVKLADYAKSGQFQYDPTDYHGPALHQVSLLWSKIDGWDSDPARWTESDLRMVSVIFGLLLLLVTFMFSDVLGRLGTALAILMSAVSPMMVFYSRYFIMEMQLTLLIAVTLGCFWRFSQGGSKLWLLMAGFALGFQHATKETFIINVAAAIVGWIAARVLIGEFQPSRGSGLRLSSSSSKKQTQRPLLWVAIPAILVSVASYSGGFRDWNAVQDSLMTYMNYLERSGGSGHEKPWHYYFTLIFWRHDGLTWSESMIGILGLFGMAYGLLGEFKNTARQAFLVFLSVYTLVLFGIYSLLSYKTPWCILSAQHSLTLLAGAGAGWIWSWMSGRITRFLFKIAIGVGIYFLCGQSKFATDHYRADQRNPYVYSHTSTDLLRLVSEVKTIASEQGEAFTAQVINRDSGWPLPWYWRTLPRVGYQMTVPETLEASVVVVDSDLIEPVKAALAKSGREYRETGPYGLRPGLYLSLLVAKNKTPEPQPVAPVIESKPEAPSPDEASLTPPADTISTAPSLMPAKPVLPALPGITPSVPAQP